MNETDIDLQIAVPPNTRYLSLVGNLAEVLMHEIKEYNGDRDLLGYHLNLVLTEAMANAIEHTPPPDKCDKLRVHIHIDGDYLCIKVYDHGEGFDLKQVQSPDFEALDEGGRGIFVIKQLMDTVDYYKCTDGNVLEMRKKLTPPISVAE
ncbi:ATP-binding protein [Candidatus Methylospira mobilis]|uniref:ATP-binding protein n=1 Tax=Candidatus Methylospira mobilis TaxID=1808979 RepID=A0A5Q0BBX8_9GAMM|nr:ATP-binding protein [Candidatus Methylospira mobilis]QFY41280.1 ATP-binding protein [Candidatus Methylospira mobilis]WNV05498.1 ATP-binding protein [Candidatus Methylospira mobilis]